MHTYIHFVWGQKDDTSLCINLTPTSLFDRSRSSPTKSFLNRFFAESSSESPVKAGGGSNNPRVKLRRSNTMSASSTSLHRPQQRPLATAAAATEEAKRSQMNVCVDCKDMILQIIKVQRANRRRQLTRSLCLS